MENINVRHLKITSDADTSLLCDQRKYVKLRIRKESFQILLNIKLVTCDKHTDTHDTLISCELLQL